MLTGDTLFVGDVGRPDLGGPHAAKELHGSLQRLLALPDFVEVYPAHISGSPCGRAMSGKPSSTIGFERRYNRSLRQQTCDEFVRQLFEDYESGLFTKQEVIGTRHGARATTRTPVPASMSRWQREQSEAGRSLR